MKIVDGNEEIVSRADFKNVKQTEAHCLDTIVLWATISLKAILSSVVVLCDNFILTIKHFKTYLKRVKGRFVVQGFKNRGKLYIVHDATNLCAASVQTLISAARIRCFKLFLHNAT